MPEQTHLEQESEVRVERGQVSLNTVFHDSLRPSHLLLPVVEGQA